MNIKKIFPPIIITCLLIVFFVFHISGILVIPGPRYIKVLGIIISLVLIGYSIFVLVERIKEIRSDEEDDLSKY